jgi:hypothetical protein
MLTAAIIGIGYIKKKKKKKMKMLNAIFKVAH